MTLDEVRNITKIIKEHFEKNKVCNSLIHFGSSIDSEKFHDVDLLCFIDEVSPKKNKKLLIALYELQDKFPEYSFTYRENKIDKKAKEKIIFSFSLFGPKIKRYHVFKYGIKNNYCLLFGSDIIKDSRKPTKTECLEYMNLMYNINQIVVPQLVLKSILRSTLLIDNIYVPKEKLILEFERLYSFKISKYLKDLIKKDIEYTNSNDVPINIALALEKLYFFITSFHNYTHNPNLRELGRNSCDPKIKINSETYRGIGKLMEVGAMEKEILSFCDKQQQKYEAFG